MLTKAAVLLATAGLIISAVPAPIRATVAPPAPDCGTLPAFPSSGRGTRPDSASGLNAADRRIAEGAYTALGKCFGVKQGTLRAIARIVSTNNPGISDSRLLEIVTALAKEAGDLRKRVADLEIRVGALEDPAVRDPALAILRRANRALDEGRLDDAARELAAARVIRWGQSEGARAAARDVIKAEATVERLRGNSDRAEELLVAAARADILSAWDYLMTAADGRYQDGLIYARQDDMPGAIRLYRQALSHVPKDDFPTEWAATQNNLGIALQTQGQRTGGAEGIALLAQAVAAYRDALTVYTRDAMPADWAMTQNNLGNALLTQGERTGAAEGIALLAKAVAAYHDALTVRTRDAMPAAWAATQNNLGNALLTQGERTGAAEGIALLAKAVAAYRDALTVYTRDAMPADWANTQNNLGTALQTQGERTGGTEGIALLAQAVAAYRDALTVYTRDAMPAAWAVTQNNLGTALSIQGERTGGAEGIALLAKAVAAYRDALTVRTRDAMPAAWAMTQNNLGTALQTQGERTGGGEGIALLAKAVAAYRDALTVRTRDAMPAAWAMTQYNLALAHESRADLGDSPRQNLGSAEAGLVDALSVFTAEHFPHQNDLATRSLARVRKKLAALRD